MWTEENAGFVLSWLPTPGENPHRKSLLTPGSDKTKPSVEDSHFGAGEQHVNNSTVRGCSIFIQQTQLVLIAQPGFGVF